MRPSGDAHEDALSNEISADSVVLEKRMAAPVANRMFRRAGVVFGRIANVCLGGVGLILSERTVRPRGVCSMVSG